PPTVDNRFGWYLGYHHFSLHASIDPNCACATAWTKFIRLQNRNLFRSVARGRSSIRSVRSPVTSVLASVSSLHSVCILSHSSAPATSTRARDLFIGPCPLQSRAGCSPILWSSTARTGLLHSHCCGHRRDMPLLLASPPRQRSIA